VFALGLPALQIFKAAAAGHKLVPALLLMQRVLVKMADLLLPNLLTGTAAIACAFAFPGSGTSMTLIMKQNSFTLTWSSLMRRSILLLMNCSRTASRKTVSTLSPTFGSEPPTSTTSQ